MYDYSLPGRTPLNIVFSFILIDVHTNKFMLISLLISILYIKNYHARCYMMGTGKIQRLTVTQHLLNVHAFYHTNHNTVNSL